MHSFIRHLIVLFLCCGFISVHAETSDFNKEYEARTMQLFASCPFTLDVTSRVGVFEDGKWLGDKSNFTFCSISLKVEEPTDHITLGGSGVGIYVLRKKQIVKEFFADNNFRKDKNGKWKFYGNPVTIGNVRFKNLSITEIYEENGVTLVGRQTEFGFNQKGGAITFNAVFIVRETSEFYVLANIAFETIVPKSRSDAIVDDLTKIVRSVRIKPE